MIVVRVGIALWIPFICYLFYKLPKHRAVIVAFVAGILFLPGLLEKKITEEAPNVIPLPWFPLSKQNVICLSVVIAALLFDRPRLRAFRLRWFDWPMILWCLCPFLSALTNAPPGPQHDLNSPGDHLRFGKFLGVDLGAPYDGFSQSRIQFLNWGIPYFVGRIYFNEANSMRELMLGMVLGGLAYIPFCLFEWIKSPIFHKMVYQFEQHESGQSTRGYFLGLPIFRPVVFMEHGLAVGMWLSATMLASFWMWWTGAVKEVKIPWSSLKVPTGLAFLLLLATSIIIKSGGAFMLGLLGLACLVALSYMGPRPVIIGLALIGPVYIVGRLGTGDTTTGWTSQTFNRWQDEYALEELARRSLEKPMFSWAWFSGEDLANFVSTDKDRQGSFTFRLINEDKLIENTRTRWLFGWGGWNREIIVVEEGEEDVGEGIKYRNLVQVDSLWIITYANRGISGLFLLYLAMLLPILRFAWIYPKELWSHPAFAPAAAGAVFVLLWMVDNVMNNMFNPVFPLIAGGIMGLTALGRPQPLAMPGAPAMVPQPAPAPGPVRRILPASPSEPAHPPSAVPQPPRQPPGLLRRRLPGQ